MPAVNSKKKTKKTTKRKTKSAGVSDDAVMKATGKSWAQWYKILDTSGAKKKTHKEIADWVNKKYAKLGGWWAQMVTVGYEQARGLRVKHEKPGGFEIGASKTINAPVSRIFKAWKNAPTRRKWLPEPKLKIHKATTNKSMRITWIDGQKSVSVNFYSKGNGKTQVAIQHGRLPSAKEADRKKAYWSSRLRTLKDLIEN